MVFPLPAKKGKTQGNIWRGFKRVVRVINLIIFIEQTRKRFGGVVCFVRCIFCGKVSVCGV